ncbi:MAG: hypothetical protein XU11_C0001G0004 [Candidatus Dadabacteria bacterium CSP1-2]|nr:MAG: hypothetical protein XU11_C0001G0004 [Candidatus Dadabacteria bacterium CSP1-2]
MRKGIACITILALFILYGCPSKEQGAEWGWKYQKPLRPQETFSHKVHENVLKKEGLTCVTCHPIGLEIEEKEEKKRAEISEAALFPGKETCHFCHYNPMAGNVAPEKCGVCHFNLLEIQPANHNFDWAIKHAVFAKTDDQDCESCHTPRFCEDCHKRRDVPTRLVHDRNYIVVHTVDARANPRTCGNCHEITFCNQCHREGGYER